MPSRDLPCPLRGLNQGLRHLSWLLKILHGSRAYEMNMMLNRFLSNNRLKVLLTGALCDLSLWCEVTSGDLSQGHSSAAAFVEAACAASTLPFYCMQRPHARGLRAVLLISSQDFHHEMRHIKKPGQRRRGQIPSSSFDMLSTFVVCTINYCTGFAFSVCKPDIVITPS